MRRIFASEAYLTHATLHNRSHRCNGGQRHCKRSAHIAWHVTPIIVSTGATARSAYATVVQHRMVCETPQNDILMRLVCNSRARHNLALYGPNLGNISY